MIVVTVFLSILNQMEFHLVQNQKEICHHDHIPFNVKGNRILEFSQSKKSRSLAYPTYFGEGEGLHPVAPQF